jgi:hypothetical protein
MWSRRTILLLAGIGALGFLGWALGPRLMADYEVLLDILAVAGVCVGLFSLIRLYIAVSIDTGLTERERSRMLRSLLFLGPAAALEIFLARRKLGEVPQAKEPDPPGRE